MDIKEIALKVADSLRNKIDGISHMQSNQGLVVFAEALVAELAKQNKPVAELLSLFPGKTDSYIKARAIGVDPFNTWAFPHPGTKLYTYPPTAEQIANETAEAIAKMLDDAEVEETHYCMNTYEEGKKFQFDMVEAILNGAWKDFKK